METGRYGHGGRRVTWRAMREEGQGHEFVTPLDRDTGEGTVRESLLKYKFATAFYHVRVGS